MGGWNVQIGQEHLLSNPYILKHSSTYCHLIRCYITSAVGTCRTCMFVAFFPRKRIVVKQFYVKAESMFFPLLYIRIPHPYVHQFNHPPIYQSIRLSIIFPLLSIHTFGRSSLHPPVRPRTQWRCGLCSDLCLLLYIAVKVSVLFARFTWMFDEEMHGWWVYNKIHGNYENLVTGREKIKNFPNTNEESSYSDDLESSPINSVFGGKHKTCC